LTLLVLHGLAALSGEFVFWAEDAELPARLPRPVRGSAATPHPFAAPAETMSRLLGVDAAPSEILLPSYGSGPLASPELVRDPLAQGPQQRGTVAIRAWTVPSVRMGAGVLLAAEFDLPDVRLGAATRYLLDLIRLTRDMVDAGRVLPGVLTDPPQARWRPALSGMDA